MFGTNWLTQSNGTTKTNKLMIKIIHTHEDGKTCLEVSSNHSLTHTQMLEILGKEYAVAYMNYTGSYYVYNPVTGEEVATLSKEFYESLKHFKVGTLDPDPNCKNETI